MDYSGSCAEELEIPVFDLSVIMKATNNFSIDKKIGEGGFGPVYKVYLVPLILSYINLVSKTINMWML